MNNFYDRELIPVEGKVGIFRDSENSAIVNTNNVEYNEYIKRRNLLMKKEEVLKNTSSEIENVKKDVDGIKNELGEIKSLLKELIQQSK
jgi:hypothetical protein